MYRIIQIFDMSRFNSYLKASTLAEVLITMILSGILLLAVYDGLDILNSCIRRSDNTDDYVHLDWLEHYEILEFRSDSVSKKENINVFYVCGEPADTLVNYGF